MHGRKTRMNFHYLVEGPLLSVALSIFLAGMVIRTTLFVLSISLNRRSRDIGKRNTTIILGRALLPYHRSAARKPLYTLSRYLFHLCVFVVPIWLYGHIVLWEESAFEFSWQPLPDMWADRLTLIVLALAAWFFLRRIFFKQIRIESSLSDYLLIILVALPFATGYFLTHEALDFIPFFYDFMLPIHVLSGELMLVMAVFMFCRIRLDKNTCIGCAACELSCPTGTLETSDAEDVRVFAYSHYQCICCGACVRTCPERAAEVRHEFGVKDFFQLFSKNSIRTVELSLCKKCRESYLPTPQLDKAETLLADGYVHLCPTCKAAATAEKLYLQDPRRKGPVPGIERVTSD
jgi:NAD-dependent dihydropyrimidine dehydrogenase PreA subunit/nitrate reductase gamma subunit